MGFTLEQFSEVFDLRDASGHPYILIGGQAVNYWAERYLAVEPQLQQLQPFTSEDIDLKGGAEDVRRIARQLKLTAVFPHKVELTALAGTIPFNIGGLKSNIEVVRRVPGVAGSLDVLAVQAERNGKMIRVLDPISLLSSKLELAARVRQEKRRDVAHLRILVPCVRAFLAEFLERVEADRIPDRHWLAAVKRVLKLTASSRARAIASRHGISWAEILPLSAIARSQRERIMRFQRQRIDLHYRRRATGR